MGEAVKNLSNDYKEKYPHIPWKKISGMRDILIHQYFGVDLHLTWEVVKEDIPKLKSGLQNVLKD